MKNDDITTIRVGTEAMGYNVGDHIKIDPEYFKIIGVAHTVLTIKPWRWYHYAYYFSKWWILGQVDKFKDFWGRVQCSKGHHKWEEFRRFHRDAQQIYYCRGCLNCGHEQVQLENEGWLSIGAISLKKDLWDHFDEAIRLKEEMYD